MAGHLGPVSGQHLPAEWVDLDLADDPQPCALQPKIETADPGEQRQHGQTHPLTSGRYSTAGHARGSSPWQVTQVLSPP